MTRSQSFQILDFAVTPEELRQYFSFDPSTLQIIYLGGYKTNSEQSLTGTISIEFSSFDSPIEQPFVMQTAESTLAEWKVDQTTFQGYNETRLAEILQEIAEEDKRDESDADSQERVYDT